MINVSLTILQGKGMMDTYWLEGIRGSISNQQEDSKKSVPDSAVKDYEKENSKSF